MTDPPCTFAAVWHWPQFYRYRVAEPGVRVRRNRYAPATIGLAVVVGRYAYCVKWADATVRA